MQFKFLNHGRLVGIRRGREEREHNLELVDMLPDVIQGHKKNTAAGIGEPFVLEQETRNNDTIFRRSIAVSKSKGKDNLEYINNVGLAFIIPRRETRSSLPLSNLPLFLSTRDRKIPPK